MAVALCRLTVSKALVYISATYQPSGRGNDGSCTFSSPQSATLFSHSWALFRLCWMSTSMTKNGCQPMGSSNSAVHVSSSLSSPQHPPPHSLCFLNYMLMSDSSISKVGICIENLSEISDGQDSLDTLLKHIFNLVNFSLLDLVCHQPGPWLPCQVFIHH